MPRNFCPYDMNDGRDGMELRPIRADYLCELQEGQLAGYHQQWLVETRDAVRAVYAKAQAEQNYGLLHTLVAAKVNLELLCQRFAPVTYTLDPDCWCPDVGGKDAQ